MVDGDVDKRRFTGQLQGGGMERLAENLGVNRSTVHRWEKGLRKIPPMAERLLATIGGNTRKSKAG